MIYLHKTTVMGKSLYLLHRRNADDCSILYLHSHIDSYNSIINTKKYVTMSFTAMTENFAAWQNFFI